METPAALRYENRMGDVYYLQQGKTPTGKPKYYVGRKLTGTPLDALPEGFEIHEDPESARVVVRRTRSSPITEFEREQVEAIIRRDSGLRFFIVEIEGNALVVYTPSMSHDKADDLIEKLGGFTFGRLSPRAAELRDWTIQHSTFAKMLRFALVNPDTRAYRAERWCFRGSIDHWIPLHESGPLAEVVEQYAEHLDRESFFEMD